MSRGGRGGRRGGRGPSVSWQEDPNMKADRQPCDLFPQYNVPIAAPLSQREMKVVEYYLQVREQIHSSPLYTRAPAANTERTRAYGQEQINQRYGVKDKASVDPFTAVPSYSQRFEKPERMLPDFGGLPFNKQFFPKELHATLDGDDGPGGPTSRPNKRRKVLELADVTVHRTAEDIRGDGQNRRKALDQLEKLVEKNDDELKEDAEVALIEDDEDYEALEEEYEDEEDGDYNAERAFDGGEDAGYDDYGDDDEAVF